MMKIITDKADIRKAQKKFKQSFETFLDKKVKGSFGHKGGGGEVVFNWSSKVRIWAVFEKSEEGRFWNAFGLKEPVEGCLRSVIAEINFPFKGVNRRVAGVFAKDEKGDTFVCHNGRIGGGKPGIGKELFLNNYRGKRIYLNDEGEEKEFALVGKIGSKRFPYQVREFVLEVDRIKKIGTGAIKKPVMKPVQGFSPEFSGEKRFKINKEVVSECDHGYIVGELARQLESKGLRVGNDRSRDLCTIGGQKNISSVFEVKPDISQNSIQTGIGQLILNSIGLPKKVRLVLVIPKRLPKQIESKIKEIGITPLVYEFKGEKVIFQKMNKLARG